MPLQEETWWRILINNHLYFSCILGICMFLDQQTYPEIGSIAIPCVFPKVFVIILLSFPSKFATKIRFGYSPAQNIRRPIQSTVIFLTFGLGVTTFTSARLLSLTFIFPSSSKYNFMSTVSVVNALVPNLLVIIPLWSVNKSTACILSHVLISKYGVGPGRNDT